MDDELKAYFEVLRQEIRGLRQEMSGLGTDLRQEISQVEGKLRDEMAAEHVETRRHFDITAEATNHNVRILAEGLDATREELVRRFDELDEKFTGLVADTQAMIRSTHAELSGRMQLLDTRVGRLESAFR